MWKPVWRHEIAVGISYSKQSHFMRGFGFDLYAYIQFIVTENWTYHLHVARRTFSVSVVSCFSLFTYLLKNMGSYCSVLLVHLHQYVNITERDKMTTVIRSVIRVIAHEEDIFHSFFIRGCLIITRRRGVTAGKDVPPVCLSSQPSGTSLVECWNINCTNPHNEYKT